MLLHRLMVFYYLVIFKSTFFSLFFFFSFFFLTNSDGGDKTHSLYAKLVHEPSHFLSVCLPPLASFHDAQIYVII